MNKVYRLIWSRSREMWIAVSEKVAAGWFRRPLTVGTLVLSALLAVGGTAKALDPNALPTGGQVVAGQASIAQSGNAMTVNQQTDKLIANWNTFNIGQNASVAFQQPGASSVALNRILDQNPSQIFGSLSANGQVFLLNPAGVYFGPTAQVDVGGLVASSLSLSNENFLAGKYKFENAGTAGSIINQGNIRTAGGGYVAFLSPIISNEGAITTPGGTTALAAGDKVSLDFTGDKLVSFAVNQGAIDAQIENKGLIRAEGGLVMMTAKAADELTQAVVNNEGVIEARGITSQGGRILLDAEGGQTTVSGTLDASSDGAQGGRIAATGDRVLVKSGSHLNASGATGGGEVLVGGSWQNSDSTVRQALETTVEQGALLEANATVAGDGGTVVAWSDVTNPLSVTAVHGRFEAKGGPEGGNGGRIETSGYALDMYGASVEASSPQGQGGLWLIDPTDITIDNGYVNGVSSNSTIFNGTAFRSTSGWTSSSGFQKDGASGFGVCMDAVRQGLFFSGKDNQTVSRTYTLPAGAKSVNFSATVGRTPYASSGNIELVFKDNRGSTISTVTSDTIWAQQVLQTLSLNNISVPNNAAQVTVVFRQVSVSRFFRDVPGNRGLALSGPTLTAFATGSGIVPTLNTGTNVTVQTVGSGSAAGNITVTASINKTAGGDATLTMKAHNNIVIQSGIGISSTSNKLNTILWSDADGNGGGIVMNNGSSIKTNGGQLWLGGGSGSTTWNGLTVGNGYAVGTDVNSNGIFLDGVTLATSNGNIALYGKSRAGSAAGGDGTTTEGIRLAQVHSTDINSGTGTILMDGVSQGTGGWAIGVEFSSLGGAAHNITSAATGDAITITGNAVAATSSTGQVGVYVHPDTTIAATGGGNISITGTGGTTGDTKQAIYFNGGAVDAGSGNLTLTGDSLYMEAAAKLQGTGSLLLRPKTAGTAINVGATGAGTLDIAAGYFSDNFVNGFSGLTIGGAAAGDITIGGSTTYNDPLTLKTAGNIVMNTGAGLTGAADQNASLVLWADADATNSGAIVMNGSSSINTNGGNVTLGGGADLSTGYAQGSDTYANGVFIKNATVSSGGGSIIMRGRSRTGGDGDGVRISGDGGPALIDSGTGTINITGVTVGSGTTYNAGVRINDLSAGKITSANTTASAITIVGDAGGFTGTSADVDGVSIEDNQSVLATGAGGGVTITGTGDTGQGRGIRFRSGANVLANGGDITITGISGATAISGADNGDTNGVTIGYKAGSDVTGSSSAISLIGDSLTLYGNDRIQSSGTLTVKPYTAGKAINIGTTGVGTLDLASSYFSENFVNGFSNITIGNAQAGNIAIAGSTTYSDPLTLKTAGNIVMNTGAGLTGATAGVDGIKSSLVLWADADANGGSISLNNSSSITTNGGHIWLGGGSGSTTWNGLTVGNGYAKRVGGAGGEAGIYLGNGVSLASNGGNIRLAGYGSGASGVLGLRIQPGFTISGGAGSVYLNGYSTAGHGMELNYGGSTPSSLTSSAASGDAITLIGHSETTTDYNGIAFFQNTTTSRSTIAATGGGNILLQGSVGAGSTGYGVSLDSIDILASSGSITLDGRTGGVKLYDGGSLYVGAKAGSAVTSSSSDITVIGDKLYSETASRFQSNGNMTVKPYTSGTTIGIAGGAGTLSLPATFFSTNLVDGFSNITVGSAQTGKIIADAFSPKDNLTLQSGSGGIELTGALDAGANTVTLNSTGVVSDTGAGAITADKLALLGSGGNYTLDSASNDVGILAAGTSTVSTGSVTYIDSNALTIGTVGDTSGIRASNQIQVSTKTGDLTLAGNLTCASTSADAVVLNAGLDTAAGTATGGNIIISGTPEILARRVLFYGGSVSGSTGLTNFIVSGTGRFRYNSDEITTNYTAALGYNGLYAIYREKPTFTITTGNQTVTYGDALSFTPTISDSYVNGDTDAERSGSALWKFGEDNYSASGLPNAGTHDVLYDGGYTSAYGYGYQAGAAATLTVNKKNLTMTANDAGKVITDSDPTLTAKYSGFVNGETIAVLDTISITRAAGEGAGNYTITPSANSTEGNYTVVPVAGTFTIQGADKLLIRVENKDKTYGSDLPGLTVTDAKYYSGTGGAIKTLTLTAKGRNAYDFDDGLGTTGSFTLTTAAGKLDNVDNYEITVTNFSKTGSNFDTWSAQKGNLAINPYVVSLAGSRAYDGTTKVAGGIFSTGTLVGDQTLTISGSGSVSSKNVGVYTTAGTTLSLGTLALGNGTNGGLATNYTLNGGTHLATITARTVTLSATKTYDGTTGLAEAVTIGNLVAGEALTYTGATASNAHVATENKYINAITLANGTGGLASNYQKPSLDAANAPVTINAATLTPTISNTGVTKVYDGTTDAPAGFTPVYTFTGLVSGDTSATLSKTGAVYNDKDVLDANKITVSGLAITGITGSNGSAVTDYTLDATAKDVSAAITAKTVTLSAAKTYDGTTGLTGDQVTIGNLIEGEALTYTGATANNAHVATENKYINAITLADGTGGLAYNYQTPTPSYSAEANSVTINAATLTPTLSNTGVTKVYDGTTDAPADFTPAYTFTGLVAGDTSATLSKTGAVYNDKDVLDANKITVSGLAITGITGSNSSAASDYALNAASKDVTAAITARTVTLSAEKIYDGTTGLTGDQVTIGNLIEGEALTYTGATANNAHVATENKYINAITLADGETALSSNYALPTLSNATTPVTINPLTLTTIVTNEGVTKVYDGTTNAPDGFTPDYMFTGLLEGDTSATLTHTGAAYNEKNVTTADTLTVEGLQLTGITSTIGSAATDYLLDSTSKEIAATITPKTVTLSAEKTYDGTTDLTGAVTVGTGIAGEALTYTKAFASNARVATADKFINAITLADGETGLASNFALPTLNSANAPVTINKAILTMTANDAGKVLTESDPTLTAKYSGFVNGETVAVLSNISVTRAAGESAATYAITPSATATEGNYTIVPVNGTFTIYGADTMLIRVAGNSKTYGSALPDFTATDAKYVTSGNVIRTLTLTPTGSNNYNFDDGLGTTGSFTLTTTAGSISDVGNYTITVTNFTKSGSNFNTQETQPGNLNITPLALAGSIAAGSSTYGSALAPGAATFTNVVGSDALTAATTVNTAGNTSTSGYLKADSYTGIQYVSSLSGAKAGNYTYADVKGNYTVTPLALTSLSGYRTYDGTTDAAGADLTTLDGKITGDVLSLTGKGAVGDKIVGENKALANLGSLALAGADAANYSLTGTTGTLTITPKALTSVSGTRVYNQTTDADGADLTTLNGKIAGDVLSLTGKGAVETKHVGENKALTSLGNLALTGDDAANYSLNDTTGSLTITAKPITATGVTASGKVYNANTAATIHTASAVITGGASADDDNKYYTGDTVVLEKGAATGAFANKNAGTDKAVAVSGFTLSGADAGNYSVSDASNVTAYIIAKSITATGVTASDKVYNANASATIHTASAVITGGASADDDNKYYTGDTVVLEKDAATGAFADKNAGTDKAVTVSGLTLSGADSVNYIVSDASNATSDITAKPITATGVTASDKVYNANTAATIHTASAVITNGAATDVDNKYYTGDDVTLDASLATGEFALKNVGANLSVTVSGLSLSGEDAANYSITDASNATADITAKPITIAGITAEDKVYDANTNATVNTSGASGWIAGDAVSVSATGLFDNKNVGENKTVTLTSSYTGDDITNYTITDQATTTASITPAPLTVTADNAAKTYGETIVFAGTEFTSNGLIGNETIGLVQLASAGAAANAGVAGSPYAITASDATGGTFLPTNYAIAYQNGALTVNKANLTVTANNDKKTFNNLPYNGGSGVVYAGFVNDETAAVLGGTLDYGGSSQGAVTVGTYDIDPLGLTSNNYTIAFKNGILTIEAPISVDPVAENRQTSNNGNDQVAGGNPTAPHTSAIGTGQGSHNIVMASVMTGSSGGSAVISTPTFSTPVSLSSTGQTMTLTVVGATGAGPMTDVGSLPVFTRSGNTAPSLQGTFTLQQSGSAVSLTPTTTGTSPSAPAASDVTGDRSAPFTLTMENGITLQMTASVTPDGVLVVSAPDAAGSINVQQAILMGAQVARQALNVELSSLSSALFVRN